MNKKLFLLNLLYLLVFCSTIYSEERLNKRIVNIEEFINLATRNDQVFDEIIIDNLRLNYRKNINLPAKDIILSVKSQYDFFLGQNKKDPEFAFSLSKLFPHSGTDVSLSYKNTPSFDSESSKSEVQFLISQYIAENMFENTVRLQDKIIGIEIDVIRYQIVEAYEDYLAALIMIYYEWYSSYENLKIGKNSYQKNLKLQDNIYERKKQKVALPIDVNKIKLLIIGKRENLIDLQETYNRLTNVISKAIRYDQDRELIPADPAHYHNLEIEFEKAYETFSRMSRTYRVLDLLENRSSLDVKKNADDLLPSTNMLFGYKADGDDWKIGKKDGVIFTGISLDWVLPNQVEKAEYEIAKIEYRKTKLSKQNKYAELYTNLKNIYLEINQEKELIEIADEKIRLAEEILNDENENYSFGKVTLNDYIASVNVVDQNKFNKIAHNVQLKKLMVEWMRLTDQLVSEKVLNDFQ